MRTVLFSFSRIYPDSMVASQRIALLISKELQIPITTDQTIGQELHKKLDLLVIVNGAFAFCRCLPELGTLVEKAHRVVWVQNDYTIIPPKPNSGAESPFRKAFRNREQRGMSRISYWTTCAEEAKLPLSHYVNWNALTFTSKRPKRTSVRKAILYYGSFREHRVPYFDRYFRSPPCDVVISSPAGKAGDRFKERYTDSHVTHVDKLDGNLSEALSKYALGLYMEDRKSHSEFHSPPNRFYEMLGAGLPMIFQPEAGMTLRKAGFRDSENYTASSARAFPEFLKRSEEIGREQAKLWTAKAQEDHDSILPSLRAAYKMMGKVVA